MVERYILYYYYYYYIENNYMFRRLIMAIFRLYNESLNKQLYKHIYGLLVGEGGE